MTSPWSATNEQLTELATIIVGPDTTFVRAHAHVFGSTEFDARAGGNRRWSPIRLNGQIVPVAYAGEDDATAAAETIFRRDVRGNRPAMVVAHKYDTWQWSTIRPRRELALTDLSSNSLQAAGIDPDALLTGGSGTYPDTRGWAERLLTLQNHVEGLSWPSRQNSDGTSIVLFGHSGAITRSDLEAVGPSVPFVSSEGTERLRELGTQFDVTVLV